MPSGNSSVPVSTTVRAMIRHSPTGRHGGTHRGHRTNHNQDVEVALDCGPYSRCHRGDLYCAVGARCVDFGVDR